MASIKRREEHTKKILEYRQSQVTIITKEHTKKILEYRQSQVTIIVTCSRSGIVSCIQSVNPCHPGTRVLQNKQQSPYRIAKGFDSSAV